MFLASSTKKFGDRDVSNEVELDDESGSDMSHGRIRTATKSDLPSLLKPGENTEFAKSNMTPTKEISEMFEASSEESDHSKITDKESKVDFKEQSKIQDMEIDEDNHKSSEPSKDPLGRHSSYQ